MAASDNGTVVALVSGYLGLKGESVQVIEGDEFKQNDPLVKLYPQLFRAQRAQAPAIEQATAAPGEKR